MYAMGSRGIKSKWHKSHVLLLLLSDEDGDEDTLLFSCIYSLDLLILSQQGTISSRISGMDCTSLEK
jgi:hypothetical protein